MTDRDEWRTMLADAKVLRGLCAPSVIEYADPLKHVLHLVLPSFLIPCHYFKSMLHGILRSAVLSRRKCFQDRTPNKMEE